MVRALSPAILRGLSESRTYLAAAAAFSCVINVLTLSIPLFSIQIYDRVLVSGSGATLAVLTVAVLGGLLAAAGLEHIRARLLVALGYEFDARFSGDLFRRQIEIGGDRGRHSGGQAVRDLDTVRNVLTGGGALALLDLPWSPIFIICCFYLHPLLGLITLFGSLTLVGLAVAGQALVVKPLSESSDQVESSYRLTDSIVRNAEAVHGMGMLPELAGRWALLRRQSMRGQAVASIRNSRVSSLIRLLRYGLQVAILACGAWLAVKRDLSPGALFAAVILGARALTPIDQIVGVWRQLISGWIAFNRVEAALALPARPSAMKLPTPTGRLSVENVSFLPAGAKAPTLANVSFAVEPGEAVGIVGPSAAGKSTLARLIVGALRPSHGVVRLDGADTYAWDRTDFGCCVGYVPQDISLFEGTISENIARFRDVGSLSIVVAAQKAGVHETILALPDGYETVLHANGAPLSAGQRQRIAIARAVFGAPKLVVLDEPNSNLDGVGEAALRQLLGVLKAQGTTVLMIAHRPSVLVGLDKVLVLANGSIIDFGTVEKIMPRIAPGFPVLPRPVELCA